MSIFMNLICETYYTSSERSISFDGFIHYEGRRFGVPFSYRQKTARICRMNDTLYIYSSDMEELLVTHSVTWSHHDSYCEHQFPAIPQPEEFPTSPVKVMMTRLKPEEESRNGIGFDKFSFGEEVSISE